MITRPQLPPKRGYVEVEVAGRRTYRNASTGVLIDAETPTPDPTADLAEALIDQECRLTCLELGIPFEEVI